ncbi:MAG: ABC-F family ATP-binding cassette domain-containing protein [Proteobacteria bacterium]|nr:ABC-F family ATP-binding cassette domain-containing protein [Desulfobulbaceae bacterium]MBU4154243.1 ABC-F family ATP-binding cassette domain-containing protein [Pseudomonadota bacterium]
MLQITNLSLQYGNKHLFKEIFVRLNRADRVGLVGVNGTGKSTLLKMMVGDVETDFGVITRSKQATIGYLPQEIDQFPPGRTLYQEARTAFDHLLTLQDELHRINQALGHEEPTSSLFADLLEQQGELQQQLDASDIFHIDARIEKILTGLGFSKADQEKDCNDFSGGWQMRLMLAKLLLTSPSFLFLDEPTNHLDIESLTWLESFLQNYQGAMVIISHDRAFLDNLTNLTWELSLGKLTIYKGNYSSYVEEKVIRQQVHLASYNNQQAKIQQTMRFVTRFRAKSTKAKQVQSRLKQLSHMDRIEVEDSEQAINFRFPPSPPSGRLAILAKDVGKSFDSKQILSNVNIEINRGDKVAIIGVNGAGKSTLVKLMAGLHQPDEGEIRLGYNVKLSYFGQHQAKDLPLDWTVLQTMDVVDSGHTTTSVRSLLGAFLFRGDEVDKKVMVLSGGEKSRLALAKMIASPANLLIMDEPTNHLDMMSQEILQEAMNQYDGSILVVSHNRFFLDAFVNKVLEVKDGRVTMYDGNLSYYLDKVKQESQNVAPVIKTGVPQTNTSSTADTVDSSQRLSSKESRQAKAKHREEKNRKLGPLKKSIAEMEKEIADLEAQKSALESALMDPDLYKDQSAFADKSILHKRVTERLERLYPNWETMQDELEQLESDL